MDVRTQAVADVLATSRQVVGVICFGSLAMGRTDPSSDIDLYVFCRPRIPYKRDRHRILKRLPELSDVVLDYPGGGKQLWPKQDKFRVSGLAFDVVYNLAQRVRTIVAKVKQGKTSIPELRFRAYTMLGLLDNSIVLYDPRSFVATLRGNLYPYPKKLKEELITSALASLHEGLNELADISRRRIGKAAFLFHLMRMGDNLSALLHAINEKYDPVTKRTEQDLARLRNLPPGFLARYESVLTGPFDEAGQERIVAEYVQLIADARAMI
jgi:predicted nucleotidyltransferase